jgi:hypothetical protein
MFVPLTAVAAPHFIIRIDHENPVLEGLKQLLTRVCAFEDLIALNTLFCITLSLIMALSLFKCFSFEKCCLR